MYGAITGAALSAVPSDGDRLWLMIDLRTEADLLRRCPVVGTGGGAAMTRQRRLGKNCKCYCANGD